MRCAIAIFAKTPSLSAVKTRLAADIGKVRAEQFYTFSLACVEETAAEFSRRSDGVHPVWALAEEEAVSLSCWQAFPAQWTGEGGLGTRLFNLHNSLLKTHDYVFLIGTDSPQMQVEDLAKAIELLEQNASVDHVAGPAKDGGFWLWASRCLLPREIWEEVSYSCETTLAELIEAVERQGQAIMKTDSLQDVDTLNDLVSLRQTLESNEKSLSAAQEVLLQWLRDNSPAFGI